MCVCGYALVTLCSHAATNLKEYHWWFDHRAVYMKDSWPLDCLEICLLSASDSPVILLCPSVHFGNTSGLSL